LVLLSDVSNIIYVEDNFPTDEVGRKSFKECDKELKVKKRMEPFWFKPAMSIARKFLK